MDLGLFKVGGGGGGYLGWGLFKMGGGGGGGGEGGTWT